MESGLHLLIVRLVAQSIIEVYLQLAVQLVFHLLIAHAVIQTINCAHRTIIIIDFDFAAGCTISFAPANCERGATINCAPNRTINY